MVLKTLSTITTAVTDTETVIATDAQIRGTDSGKRDECHFVRVHNRGTDDIDVFDGDTPTAQVIFGDGWGIIPANGWLDFTVERGDIPINGLKAICDTGNTATVKVNRG